MAVGNEARDEVNQEVDGAAMARMLYLADIFELIGDGLDNDVSSLVKSYPPLFGEVSECRAGQVVSRSLFVQYFGSRIVLVRRNSTRSAWERAILTLVRANARAACCKSPGGVSNGSSASPHHQSDPRAKKCGILAYK